jgi:hypothetical protein
VGCYQGSRCRNISARLFLFPGQDSDLDCLTCNAGVLTLDERGTYIAPIPGPLPFLRGDWGSGLFVILAPVPSAGRLGAPTVVIALPFDSGDDNDNRYRILCQGLLNKKR